MTVGRSHREAATPSRNHAPDDGDADSLESLFSRTRSAIELEKRLDEAERKLQLRQVALAAKVERLSGLERKLTHSPASEDPKEPAFAACARLSKRYVAALGEIEQDKVNWKLAVEREQAHLRAEKERFDAERKQWRQSQTQAQATFTAEKIRSEKQLEERKHELDCREKQLDRAAEAIRKDRKELQTQTKRLQSRERRLAQQPTASDRSEQKAAELRSLTASLQRRIDYQNRELRVLEDRINEARRCLQHPRDLRQIIGECLADAARESSANLEENAFLQQAGDTASVLEKLYAQLESLAADLEDGTRRLEQQKQELLRMGTRASTARQRAALQFQADRLAEENARRERLNKRLAGRYALLELQKERLLREQRTHSERIAFERNALEMEKAAANQTMAQRSEALKRRETAARNEEILLQTQEGRLREIRLAVERERLELERHRLLAAEETYVLSELRVKTIAELDPETVDRLTAGLEAMRAERIQAEGSLFERIDRLQAKLSQALQQAQSDRVLQNVSASEPATRALAEFQSQYRQAQEASRLAESKLASANLLWERQRSAMQTSIVQLESQVERLACSLVFDTSEPVSDGMRRPEAA